MNKQKQKQKRVHLTKSNKTRRLVKTIHEKAEEISQAIRRASDARWDQILLSLKSHAK